MGESLECPAAELYALGRDLVGSGASLRFEVRGWSMYPFIRNGDVIEVAPVLIDKTCVGDVVLFRCGERLLAHRVVGQLLDGQSVRLRVRGDRFLNEDPPIAEPDLLGQVRLVYRNRRLIRLDRGLNRYLGSLVARKKIAHRGVRWLARNRQRCTALGKKLAALKAGEL